MATPARTTARLPRHARLRCVQLAQAVVSCGRRVLGVEFPADVIESLPRSLV
jgi:hypothetical protein